VAGPRPPEAEQGAQWVLRLLDPLLERIALLLRQLALRDGLIDELGPRLLQGLPQLVNADPQISCQLLLGVGKEAPLLSLGRRRRRLSLGQLDAAKHHGSGQRQSSHRGTGYLPPSTHHILLSTPQFYRGGVKA